MFTQNNRKILIVLLIILLSGCVSIKEDKTEMGTLKLTSPAFEHNGKIPDRYTCKGKDVNPPLNIEGAPAETQSFVLIVDDPDAPVGIWDHWIVLNIPLISEIEEDSVPLGASEGLNSFGRTAYGGPCPPSGTHRYFFKLYALDTLLRLDKNTQKEEVEKAMKGHILDRAELIGLYSK